MKYRIPDILNVCNQYEEHLECWKSLLPLLEPTRKELAGFPKPTVLRDGFRLEFSIASKTLYLEFSYNGKRGALTYGFVVRDEFGRAKDHVHHRDYFDHLGNVFTSPAAGKSDINLKNDPLSVWNCLWEVLVQSFSSED